MNTTDILSFQRRRRKKKKKKKITRGRGGKKVAGGANTAWIQYKSNMLSLLSLSRQAVDDVDLDWTRARDDERLRERFWDLFP